MSTEEANLKFKPVNPQNDYPKMEEEILEMWEQNGVYEKTQELRSQGGEKYSWLEGPPTANGKPHAGHALTRTLKDIMLRYQTMKGKYVVPRIGGWDCHGLPVELEIEKELGINSKQEIEDYGIKNFNEKCRESVLRYTNEWIEMSKRIGFWLDMDNSYVTMTDEYIESVWWSLKTQYDKGLIYKGTRVAPYCARCGTTLSSHELALGYDEVTDPAIFIKFKAADMDDVKYLAWTTTPWTLISNVMLTVHPDFDYVVVDHDGEKLLLAEALIDKVFGIEEGEERPEILEKYKGSELEGREYIPIFPFFEHLKNKGYAFKVTLADYVELESGSGIVHSAPAFGADDAATGNKYGAPVVNPVDRDGKFDERVGPLAGMWVKDADKEIIRILKEEDKLLKQEEYTHNYPHCWRCDTPLLYYGTESWFIRMSDLQENLVNNNNQVLWQPNYIKQGRFGNFIEKAVDWNLSRSRYWGTPLPAWVCDTCAEVDFVSGKQDLMDRVGKLPEDFELHRPWVDEISWDHDDCEGTYIRDEYVIDTWYDSGSAPFAQYHYPFDNQEKFENEHPYDFITEAIDQTRGWFYSLLAVSTAVFDKPAYMSVLCMNHVLAEDGSKMSKSKGNAISPDEMFNTVGADATRWYLSATPAWNPMRFGPNLVAEAQRRVFNTLWNVYSFFVTNANVDSYTPTEVIAVEERPEIDRWIISRLQNLIKDVKTAFEEISFHEANRALEYFIVEELSNWHVRRSRRRFYDGEMGEDKKAGYDTLYDVLTTLARLMAPLTPYLAEELYQNLERPFSDSDLISIHMHLFPEAQDELIDEKLEQRMAIALSITNAARAARAEARIKARQPLPLLAVNLEEEVKLPKNLQEVIREEINVKELVFIEDDEKYVDYKVQPMLKVLAPRVKGAITSIKSYLEGMDRSEAKRVVKTVNRTGEVELEIDGKDWTFNSEEILVHSRATEGFALGENRGLEVYLKTDISDELKLEGIARGLVRHIQEARKVADLDYTDRIRLYLGFDSEQIKLALEKYEDYITSEVQADELELQAPQDATEADIEGHDVRIAVEKL